MSAQWRGDEPAENASTLVALTPTHLDALMAIENAAYAFPWTRGNFIDSIAAGYSARVLLDARGAMLGYFIAMAGVDEMHLLNITVAPVAQSRGHARRMIDALIALCRERAAHALWLEVRQSNARAREIYARLGFVQQGVRKGYYPAPLGRREDAVVMNLKIGAGDGLE
ncbi:MAG: ribosomal protein S18-alanine N-acetyltransferase [Burkholderiales bacterium]